MTRTTQASSFVDDDWSGVSERNRCPICGANAKCRLHADDVYVSCMHSPSEWPLTNGAWLHRVGGSRP